MTRTSIEECDTQTRALAWRLLEKLGFKDVTPSNGRCFYDFAATYNGRRICIELKAREDSAWGYDEWFIGERKFTEFTRHWADILEDDDNVPQEERFDAFFAMSLYPGLKRFAIANVVKEWLHVNYVSCPATTLVAGGPSDKVNKLQRFFDFRHCYAYDVLEDDTVVYKLEKKAV